MSKLILAHFIFISLILASIAHANDITIVEVRKNIPLADNDPVYKDFYINAGSVAGLKTGLVVTAMRKLPIKDASGAQAFGEILVPVGQLKVIFVSDKLAIAREHKALSRENLPMLEQTGVLNGDVIELKGSFVDNTPPEPAKKVVQNDTKEQAPVVEKIVEQPVAAIATVAAEPPKTE